MKNIVRFFSVLLCVTGFASASGAATLTGSISGIDPSLEIAGYTIFADVDPGFTVNGFDFGAYPGWGHGFEQAEVSGNQLIIGNIDFEGFAGISPNNPLTDGQLFTIDYTGTLGAFTVLFNGYSDDDIYNSFNVIQTGSDSWLVENTATFRAESTNPVPVPAAIYLFGAGIAGLFGMRRRARG